MNTNLYILYLCVRRNHKILHVCLNVLHKQTFLLQVFILRVTKNLNTRCKLRTIPIRTTTIPIPGWYWSHSMTYFGIEGWLNAKYLQSCILLTRRTKKFMLPGGFKKKTHGKLRQVCSRYLTHSLTTQEHRMTLFKTSHEGFILQVGLISALIPNLRSAIPTEISWWERKPSKPLSRPSNLH